MDWASRWRFVLCLSLTLGGPIGSAGASHTRLVVRVYDYAGVPKGTMTGAVREARRIFSAVGVQLSLVDCPTSQAEIDNFPACREREGLSDFSVKILPESMAARLPGPSKRFGVALQIDAFVFFDRVHELSESGQFSEAVVLGHVVAHELGHLLLGEASHSAEGLMSAWFRRTDLERAEKGGLLFTARQAERIRVRLGEHPLAMK